MIHVDKTVPVNTGRQPGEPALTRSQIWQGPVLKAENALPFVAAATRRLVKEGGLPSAA